MAGERVKTIHGHEVDMTRDFDHARVLYNGYEVAYHENHSRSLIPDDVIREMLRSADAYIEGFLTEAAKQGKITYLRQVSTNKPEMTLVLDHPDGWRASVTRSHLPVALQNLVRMAISNCLEGVTSSGVLLTEGQFDELTQRVTEIRMGGMILDLFEAVHPNESRLVLRRRVSEDEK